MYKIIYSPKAEKYLQHLPSAIVKRITDKMDWFARQDDPLKFSKTLQGSELSLFRFRIGDYRIICEKKNGALCILAVLTIGHRKNVYQ